MTKNGKIILDIIKEVTCHPTAEDIYHMLYEKGISMSVATVYNNLNDLYRAGAIRKISMHNQPDRYDKLERHDHLVCKKCGKIKDLFMKDFTKDVEKETNLSIDSYDLQLFYICELCKQ